MPKIIKHNFRGEKLTLSQIIKRTGCKIPYQTLNTRIRRDKMEVEVALVRPVKKIHRVKKRTSSWGGLSDKPRTSLLAEI